MRAKRKSLLLYAIVMLCGAVISCFNTADNPAKKLTDILPFKGRESVEVAKSNVSRNTSPGATTEELQLLAGGNTRFALDVYGAAAAGGDNIFFSPYSISVAMAMAYGGARGETAQEMADAMHFNVDGDRLHNAFNDIDLRLNADDGEGLTLSIANAAWCQRNYSFEEEYLDLIAANYGSGVFLLNFAAEPEQSRKTINTWISDQTRNIIKDLVPEGVITSLTRFVLTNAIYFKAEWLNKFTGPTEKGAFHGNDGDSQADMMSGTAVFPYYDADGFTALELPYKGGKFSMLLILPDEGKFSDIEGSLDADAIGGILAGLEERDVSLTMPKFSFKRDLDLKNILQGLGMDLAFTPPADFSGITTASSLYITDVLHRAFVAVSEEGTEAAAATVVVFRETCAPPPPIYVSVDRPFIFLILHRQTGSILFMGRVINL